MAIHITLRSAPRCVWRGCHTFSVMSIPPNECARCGTALSNDLRFCTKCGEPIPAEAPAPTALSTPPAVLAPARVYVHSGSDRGTSHDRRTRHGFGRSVERPACFEQPLRDHRWRRTRFNRGSRFCERHDCRWRDDPLWHGQGSAIWRHAATRRHYCRDRRTGHESPDSSTHCDARQYCIHRSPFQQARQDSHRSCCGHCDRSAGRGNLVGHTRLNNTISEQPSKSE